MKQKLFLTLALLMTVCSFGMAQSKQAYAVLSEDEKTLTFYYDDLRSMITTGTVYELPNVSLPGWISDEKYNIEKVVFTDAFKYARPVSTYCWFDGLNKLSTIEGISNLNTSEVEDMMCMFQSCTSLEELNLSTFNTSKVKYMSYMFNECTNLKQLNIRNFDTSMVNSMTYMFSNCTSLTDFIWSDFNTQKVEYMTSMFKGCASLPDLKLNFDASNVRDMTHMFDGCTNMRVLDLRQFVTSEVSDLSYMFKDCQSLQRLILGKNFKTTHVVDMQYMFAGCSSLPMLNLTNFETNSVTDMHFMFDECSSLKRIYVGDGWNTDNVPTLHKMFIGCSSLEGEKGTKQNDVHVDKRYAHIDGGESNPGYLSARPSGYVVLEGNSLTFYNDGKMDEKDGPVYPLNIGSENPTWPRNRAVDRVVFDESFATARPVSTFFWFNGCTILTEFVGMQYLNTSEVTDMEGMFMDCTSISNLDLSHFNTSKVTRMPSMFASCNNLQELDLSNFDTSNVTSMTLMFYGCKSLETLDLSSFNTSNVAYMIYMFSECSELKTLNIGSFNTGNAADQMSMMFQNCGNLTTIYVGRKWTVSNSGCYAMFSGCNSLVGGQGTKYNETEYNPGMNTFAHIDGGPSNRGYLTAAPSLGIATSLNQVTSDKSQVTSDEWYTIDGRKLNGKPAKKGIYIHNGKKAVLKN